MTATLRYHENGRQIEQANLAEARRAERAFIVAHRDHAGFSTIAETTHHCHTCRRTFTRGDS